ncbi:glycosyltransferase (activator-dependent family) [Streptomyces umbrinus]|uniref:Glycosyltransferase (Activator-dependent family) n=1 Tax=Streptomyces umbrinus TaxID=67370 RepID=A0ABU0SNF7_9ACTN|nr:activator-dependent family glycosyltransferase [Streptomyces umbrinus]MDQ1025073.1 glycosyltransferase (activator-dependent family) [Streptomyces umbrinus]
MRVLLTTIPEKSHLFCMTPLAWAIRAAGHEVRVASCKELADVVAATGMTAVPTGTNHGINASMHANRDAQEAAELISWNELDPAKLTYEAEAYRAQVVAYACAMFNETMIPDMVEFARAWRPDLVVWDSLTYAGPIVAGVVGAAHVRSLCFADVWVKKREILRELALTVPAAERKDPLAEWLSDRAEEFGGAYSEELTTGQLTLDPLPESLGIVTGAPRTPLRFVPYNGPAIVPDWLRTPPERTRICMSLGASNTERHGGDYVSKGDILGQLAELDAEVVAALLPAQLEELGPLPDNVRAVSSVPLHALLPSCSLLIHHGGFGSYANALVYGVPQLTVTTPLADQLYRGAGIEQQGAGLLLGTDRATPEAVYERASRILADTSFQQNASRLREEATALPSPAEVVPVLELLARQRRATPWQFEGTATSRLDEMFTALVPPRV